jgi:hypothetical protein
VGGDHLGRRSVRAGRDRYPQSTAQRLRDFHVDERAVPDGTARAAA